MVHFFLFTSKSVENCRLAGQQFCGNGRWLAKHSLLKNESLCVICLSPGARAIPRPRFILLFVLIYLRQFFYLFFSVRLWSLFVRFDLFVFVINCLIVYLFSLQNHMINRLYVILVSIRIHLSI